MQPKYTQADYNRAALEVLGEAPALSREGLQGVASKWSDLDPAMVDAAYGYARQRMPAADTSSPAPASGIDWSKSPIGVHDPAVADKLYEQVVRMRDADIGGATLGSKLWSGDGFGGMDANTQALVGYLMTEGISDLSQIGRKATPRKEEATFTADPTSPSGWTRVDVDYSMGENGQVTRTPVSVEDAARMELPEAPGARRFGHSEYDAPSSVVREVDSGKKDWQLYNTVTGEPLMGEGYAATALDPEGRAFEFAQNRTGKGRIGFNVMFQQVPDGQGGMREVAIPFTSQKGASGFLADVAPMALTLASFIPATAPFARAASGLMSLKSGNPLGALASVAGAVPGIDKLAGLGMSADTLNAVKNVGLGASALSAAQNKDLLGFLSAAGRAPGMPAEIAGVPTARAMQGLGSLAAAQRGDYVGAALGGLGAAGQQTVPGTDVGLDQAREYAGLYNFVKDKRYQSPAALAALLSQLPQSRTPIRAAAGGHVPDLNRYMRGTPREAKLRGLAAIANGA